MTFLIILYIQKTHFRANLRSAKGSSRKLYDFVMSTKVDHVNDTYSVIATDVDEVWGILKKWWENLWPLQPHVTINKTGQIENPPCNCKAGKLNYVSMLEHSYLLLSK